MVAWYFYINESLTFCWMLEILERKARSPFDNDPKRQSPIYDDEGVSEHNFNTTSKIVAIQLMDISKDASYTGFSRFDHVILCYIISILKSKSVRNRKIRGPFKMTIILDCQFKTTTCLNDIKDFQFNYRSGSHYCLVWRWGQPPRLWIWPDEWLWNQAVLIPSTCRFKLFAFRIVFQKLVTFFT